jgi:hypothetical protein
MSQYEFENNNEGEWEENEDVAWNEADWQKFLRNADKDVSRFISAYNKVFEDPERLDAAAAIMGWHRDDWSSIDEELNEEEIKQLRPVEMEELKKMAPYTIHRHPIYLSSIGLYAYLRNSWEHFMRNNRNQPAPHLAWSYSASLADGERHSLLAANCLDLGDYLLAVCHFKKAHSALNESLRLNRLFTHQSEKVLIKYRNESNIRLHDLREIWLRVMHDCRS